MKRLLLAFAMVLAWALPAQALSDSPTVPWAEMVGNTGRVRTIEIVNGRIYIGGMFDSFRDIDGTVSQADNLAVLNLNGQFVSVFPTLPNGQVWDLTPYQDGVLIAGK